MSSPFSLVKTCLSSPRIANLTVSSTLFSLPPLSFQDKYILATSPLGFNLQCIVINVLVFPSICSNSAPVQSGKAAEYLINEIDHVFISVIIFPPISFLVSLSLVYSTVLTFSFIAWCFAPSACITPKYL